MKFFVTRKLEGGSILIMTLVFVVLFTVLFASMSGLISRQYHESTLQKNNETAFQIAEAGLNFARWRLAHNAQDLSSATKTLSDQFAGALGTYSLTFSADPSSSIVTITSVGDSIKAPGRTITLTARYGIPSLAQYASITNSDVWYSGTMKGPIHSNGGVRMDATSDSTVSSAKATYVCQPMHGCNNVTKAGVWGTGQDANLWQFPAPPVDYNAISQGLLAMKNVAIAANTYYGPSGVFGYHLVFNTNNTYDLYQVKKKTANISSYTAEKGWESSSFDIGQEALIVSGKAVPAGGILYFEDTVWVQGSIRSRISIAAGVFPDSTATNADIIINGSITYDGVKDGTRVFGAVAQRDVLLPYSGAANVLEMDGAFIAQKGKFGRHYYSSGSYILRQALNQYGMIASNTVPVTTWVNGSGQVVSGYQGGSSEYDSHLLYGPPPYFPTSGQYEFISWDQQ